MQTEKRIYEILLQSFENVKYGSFGIEVIRQANVSNNPIDFLIKAGEVNIAAIEVKSTKGLTKKEILFSTDFYFQFKVRYFIYTDGYTFYVYDRFNSPQKSIGVDIDELINTITVTIKKSELSGRVITVINGVLEKSKLPQIELLKKHFKKMKKAMSISKDYSIYFDGIKGGSNSFENEFFIKLLDNRHPNKIYRYSTFQRIFETIRDNSIAMHGLPGMNDTTEPNYVDNYLNSPYMIQEPWEMSHQSRAAINRRFIMSCTELEDDLLGWRLYGDDSKGANIELSLKEDFQRNRNFYVGKVKYADQNNIHPELELLKNIISAIRQQLLINIRFVLLYSWRHFFKPKEYAYEKEVRILYKLIGNAREKKWIMAGPNAIVNPMVVFDLNRNEFPFEISRVIIGPNKSERKMNRSQLEQMISEKHRNCVVEESRINVYR